MADPHALIVRNSRGKPRGICSGLHCPAPASQRVLTQPRSGRGKIEDVASCEVYEGRNVPSVEGARTPLNSRCETAQRGYDLGIQMSRRIQRIAARKPLDYVVAARVVGEVHARRETEKGTTSTRSLTGRNRD